MSSPNRFGVVGSGEGLPSKVAHDSLKPEASSGARGVGGQDRLGDQHIDVTTNVGSDDVPIGSNRLRSDAIEPPVEDAQACERRLLFRAQQVQRAPARVLCRRPEAATAD